MPFDGYTDKAATEKKLVRNAFKDGDVWFNTGDVMSPQGLEARRAFADRIGDTFRWKGENATTRPWRPESPPIRGGGVCRVQRRGASTGGRAR